MKAAPSLHPGVKVTNLYDDGGRSTRHQRKAATVYIFFNPKEQVKSADPVTYDDNGNVIPLSERFTAANEDIRYSTRNGHLLTADEYRRVNSAWNDYHFRGYQFETRRNGGIIIDLDSSIVYTDGNGSPEYVLDVGTDDRWSNNDVYNLVVEMEKEGKSHEVQRRILKSILGTEGAHFRTGRKRKRTGGQDRKGTGRNAREVGFGNPREVSEEITDSPDGIEIDEDTESAYPAQYSIRTWADSDYVTQREEAAKRLAKTIDMSVAKAKKWIDDVNSVSAYHRLAKDEIGHANLLHEITVAMIRKASIGKEIPPVMREFGLGSTRKS